MINNILPYFRKKTSTLLTLSAASLLLLSSAVLPLSNPLLLQPVQAQTPMTFKTPTPATYTDPATGHEWTLTFDAQGTASSSDPQHATITNGTFQIDDIQAGKILYSGNIIHGSFTNNTSGGLVFAQGELEQGGNFYITTSCSSSDPATIDVDIHTNQGDETFGFEGAVECSSQGGGNTTTAQQSSSSSTPMTAGTTTTTQQDSDGDGDGIPDYSDKCTHNSNPRCFKEEGDTGTATQSSTSMAGNQTR
jgi:hypothetical protein